MNYPFTAAELWKEILSIFQTKLSNEDFEETFNGTELILHEGNKMVIVTPNNLSHLLLSLRYGNKIAELAFLLTDLHFEVSFDNQKHIKTEVTFEDDQEAISEFKNKLGKKTERNHSDQPLTAQELWNTVLDRLSAELSRPSFDTWLKSTKALSIEEDFLVVEASNDFSKDWLEIRYKQLIDEILSSCQQNLTMKVVAPTEKHTASAVVADPFENWNNTWENHSLRLLEQKIESVNNKVITIEEKLDKILNILSEEYV